MYVPKKPELIYVAVLPRRRAPYCVTRARGRRGTIGTSRWAMFPVV